MSAIYSIFPLEYMLCLLYVFLFLLILFQFGSLFSLARFGLFKSSLGLFLRPNRSQFADSGNMCMMSWAGTPAAQALPRARGDTTRGELSPSAAAYDALLASALARSGSHLCQRANSPTSASDMLPQWLIHNQDTTGQILIVVKENQCTRTHQGSTACAFYHISEFV